MASDFLKNMAQRQAEKIDREYGADAYGGSNWRQQHSTGGGAKTTQTQQTGGASSFLRSSKAPPPFCFWRSLYGSVSLLSRNEP